MRVLIPRCGLLSIGIPGGIRIGALRLAAAGHMDIGINRGDAIEIGISVLDPRARSAIDQLGQYIQELGGGPQVPEGDLVERSALELLSAAYAENLAVGHQRARDAVDLAQPLRRAGVDSWNALAERRFDDLVMWPAL